MDYSDFYVYLHRRKDNNEIFYIGKGRLNRAFIKNNRNDDWTNIVNQYGYYVEFIKTDLTNDEAIDLEFKLINENFNLVNKLTNKSNTIIPDIQVLKEWVEYDPSSSSGLRWIKSNGKIKSGNICGVLRNNRYSFSLFKTRFICSRIVWLLNNGKLTNNMVIDHIDGNSLNNNINNLREVSYKQNANNTSKQRSNLNSLGIVEYTSKDKNGNITFHCYGSYYDSCGKEIRKSFSYLKYGKENAIQLAINFRKEGLNVTIINRDNLVTSICRSTKSS